LARRRPRRRSFGPTTKWQTIREAGAAGPQRREAFASLYRSYHPPVFEFIQRQGVPPARAADIAQDFFVRLFTKPDLERLDPQRGSFRGWLRFAAKNFVRNRFKSLKAKVNGGGVPHVSIEEARELAADSAEPIERLLQACRDQFIVRRAYERLQREYPMPWEAAVVSDLYRWLAGEGRLSTDAELAEQLGSSTAAVRARRRRIRAKFEDYLRSERARWTLEPCHESDALDRLAWLAAQEEPQDRFDPLR
jgi:RNA polymerase sigma factor (sigma-70 family)